MRTNTVLLSIMLSATMITGAYATWKYAESLPSEEHATVGIVLNTFNYKPEEVLPNDQEANQLGQNHKGV